MVVPRESVPVHASLLRAQAAVDPGQPMGLVVRSAAVRPVPGPADRYAYGLRFEDYADGFPIEVLPTSNMALVQAANRALLDGSLAVAYGQYLHQGTPNRDGKAPLRFALDHLRTTVRTTDLVGASPDEISAARSLIARLSATPGALEQHLLARLADIHQIATKSLSPRFQRCVRLVLLQALSQGQVGPGSNPRLSLAFISEPGQGKAVLARYAETLAPSAPHAQPGLITPAGLAVRVEPAQGIGFLARAGALAKAHGGTCIIDDLHRMPRTLVNLFEAILMGVAEEALLKPTKAACNPYVAECALHLNGNYRHLMEEREPPRGPRARLYDLGLPLDLFTRIDIVAALCIGDEIDKLALELATQRLEARSEAEWAQVAAEVRALKVLCAVLRDDIPQVDLEPVEGEVGTLLQQVQTILKEQVASLTGAQEGLFDPGALSLRMGRTLRKLVGSAARLDGRKEAEQKDVERAAEAIQMKLEVTSWVCGSAPQVVPLGGLLRQHRRAEMQAELRGQKALEVFGGRRATVEEVAAGLGCGPRTARRTLRGLGLGASGGAYQVPTPLQHELMQEEAEERGEVLEAPPETEEGEEPEIEEGPRMRDSLPKVPVRYRELVEGYKEVAGAVDGRPEQLVRVLVMLATVRVLTAEQKLQAMGLVSTLPEACEELEEGQRDLTGAAYELKGELLEAEPGRRSGLALSVLTGAWALPDPRERLEEALLQDDLTPEMRRHIESAVARLNYYEERGWDVDLQL